MKNTLIILTCLFMISCSFLQLDNLNKHYFQCRLELYCTKTEDSLIKRGAFKALESYFGMALGDGLCEKHYQPWGFDYRKPAQQRCGTPASTQDNSNRSDPCM